MFEAAHRFKHDRFLQSPRPLPVISFGRPGSPHYCLGSELAKSVVKITIADMLRKFRLQVKPERKGFTYVPEIKPKSGVVVHSFQRREQLDI